MIMPLLQFAISGLQDPDWLAGVMADTGITPESVMPQQPMGGTLGELAQPIAFRPDQPIATPQTGDFLPPQGGPNPMLMPAPQQVAPTEAGGAGVGGAGQLLQQPQVMQAKASTGEVDSLRSRFMSRLRQQGITNPNALAAIEATGLHESGFDPNNVFGTWADPSQSGQAGTSGGALSWRAERLQNLMAFGGGEGLPDVETQADFLLQEDPQLIEALNNAQSPEEAIDLMNNAWRFAGYENKAGGEAADRMATARRLAGQQDTSRTGSSIDFARATGDSVPTPPIGTESGPAASKIRTARAVASGQAAKPDKKKTLAEKLAELGEGLQVPEAPPSEGAPRLAGIEPQVGGGFNPQSLEQMMLMLGAGGGGQLPSLAQLINQARGGG